MVERTDPAFMRRLLPLLALAALVVPPAGAAELHRAIDGRDGCDVCHPGGLPTAKTRGLTDTRTTGCLTCHDGGLAVSPFGMADTGGDEHPFHVVFEGDDLRDPVEVLASGLRLYKQDGQWMVECTSCHDPHVNGRPAMLRGEPGDLCGACHRI